MRRASEKPSGRLRSSAARVEESVGAQEHGRGERHGESTSRVDMRHVNDRATTRHGGEGASQQTRAAGWRALEGQAGAVAVALFAMTSQTSG